MDKLNLDNFKCRINRGPTVIELNIKFMCQFIIFLYYWSKFFKYFAILPLVNKRLMFLLHVYTFQIHFTKVSRCPVFNRNAMLFYFIIYSHIELISWKWVTNEPLFAKALTLIHLNLFSTGVLIYIIKNIKIILPI